MIAGAGFGAAKALEDIMAEQMVRAQMAQRQQLAQQELEQRQQQIHAQIENQRAMRDLETRRIDLADTQRRDRNNQQQYELMQQDRAKMDEEQILSGLDPKLRTIAGLRKVGVTGISPEDLDTPDERNVRDRAAITRAGKIAEAQAAGAAKYRTPKEPDYQRVLVDGKETFLTPEEVRARGGTDAASRKRASTGVERQALGFYNRMNDALNTMDAVENQLSERDIMLINNSPLSDLINNRLLSEAGQQYAQALNTYTEARLRKESGAAIPASEFETDRRTIGRQANDQGPVRAQKRQTRRRTAEGVAYASGPAYEEFYGEPFQRMAEQSAGAPLQKEIPGIPGSLAESRDGGKTWIRVK